MVHTPGPSSFFTMRMPLVLASASPRRREFLAALGFSFRAEAAPEEAEPLPLPGETPKDYVLRAALAKAAYVRAQELRGDASKGENAFTPPAAYLGADTTVVLDGDILGKPRDADEAFCFLRRLSGREHRVVSAVALCLPDGSEECFTVGADVRLASWPDTVLRAYAESGEPLDKAGGYAVQGRGAFLVESVTGSWSAVVGLPLAELVALLLRKGVIA